MSAFYDGELFETAMIDFFLLDIQGEEGGFFNGHLQVTSRPIFYVGVCADCPEHLDPAIAFEMHQTSLGRDQDLSNGAVTTSIKTDLPSTFQLGESIPNSAVVSD